MEEMVEEIRSEGLFFLRHLRPRPHCPAISFAHFFPIIRLIFVHEGKLSTIVVSFSLYHRFLRTTHLENVL